ncbi:hypothetical protein [uncultured Cellulomonas sp.]|uniref:hypothetical protein n=1 Tax=uncultured Cellulomonas sp. TaxID=189682 RepID=UPI0026262B63|nr:hypothetical protein [uncultured Cellulomonas sp.]
MSEPWDAEVFRVPDIAWQAEAPPTRHPVPVGHVPDLDVGDDVTIGVPGHYFIDGQVVALVERGHVELPEVTEKQEALAVAAPFAYWLAKGFPQAGLTMQWWPVEHCWTYRDAATGGCAAKLRDPLLHDAENESWLDHVQPTLQFPPDRRPRPAREVGVLSGRTLRLQNEPETWSWWIGVSEPVHADGEVVVHVMRPSDYWLTQVAREPVEPVLAVPLYRLWGYE